MAGVRDDAPWCPSNIEFIRRINGLADVDDVERTVFDATYVVLGLGDVYLGAPLATPVDPRHRLVTTKYNPARTSTAQNSVGIGGSYLCIYGLEGPGGYQLIGRTVQIWSHFAQRRPSSPACRGCSGSSTASAGTRSVPRSCSTPGPTWRRAGWTSGSSPACSRWPSTSACWSTTPRSIAAFRARQAAAFVAERAAWERAGEFAAP